MPKVCDSSTVMTPSLPTLSMASEIISPISSSAAEMAATWAICSLSSTSLARSLMDVDGGLDGGLDALLERHRVGAGGHVAQALAHHRPGQHRGGGGAVTGDVVGLLGDFLDQLGADLLVRVLELDLLGDGDAVVGDRGRAPLLLEHDVAALRAEGDAHGVGELVHARLEGAAGLLVERDDLGHAKCPSVGLALSASRLLTGNQNRGADLQPEADGDLGWRRARDAPEADAPIVVVGAGVAGLGTALALARAGHRVTLLERDATPLPADPDAAFEWDRRGAPQVRHSHALLARLRNLLRDRYPDVLDDLLDAGRHRDPLRRQPAGRDRRPRPPTRRRGPRRAGLPAHHVRVGAAPQGAGHRRGDAARRRGGRRLLAEPTPSGPRVTGRAGARGRCGGRRRRLGREIPGLDGGRRARTPLGRARVGWASSASTPTSRSRTPASSTCSRFYRLHDDAERPPSRRTDRRRPRLPQVRRLPGRQPHASRSPSPSTPTTRAADPPRRPDRLRPGRPDRCRPPRPWVDGAVTEADHRGARDGRADQPQGHLRGRRRASRSSLGFHAVGDAHTCTNPLYGRGLLAGDGAGQAPGRRAGRAPGRPRSCPIGRVRGGERPRDPTVVPRLGQPGPSQPPGRGRPRGGAGPDAAPASGARRAPATTRPGSEDDADRTTREFMQSIMRDGLLPAVRTDATVFRAFVRAFNLLDPPELITTDPDVVEPGAGRLPEPATSDRPTSRSDPIDRPARRPRWPLSGRTDQLRRNAPERGESAPADAPSGLRTERARSGRCWGPERWYPRGDRGRSQEGAPAAPLRF